MNEHVKRQMEVIEWLDHCSRGGDHSWKDIGDVIDLEPALVISVGFVLVEKENFLILVSHAGPDQCCGEMLILKSLIIRREILKPTPTL